MVWSYEWALVLDPDTGQQDIIESKRPIPVIGPTSQPTILAPLSSHSWISLDVEKMPFWHPAPVQIY